VFVVVCVNTAGGSTCQ